MTMTKTIIINIWQRTKCWRWASSVMTTVLCWGKPPSSAEDPSDGEVPRQAWLRPQQLRRGQVRPVRQCQHFRTSDRCWVSNLWRSGAGDGCPYWYNWNGVSSQMQVMGPDIFRTHFFKCMIWPSFFCPEIHWHLLKFLDNHWIINQLSPNYSKSTL